MGERDSHSLSQGFPSEFRTQRSRLEIGEAQGGLRLPRGWCGHDFWRLGIVVGAIAATTVAHCLTPLDVFIVHNVLQRFYYVPIFAAAYWFGLPGAMTAAVLSAASYLPHIILDWGEVGAVHSEYVEAQYAELIMFQVVAFLAGQLSRVEARLRETQQRTSRELADADQELRDSFEHLRRADRMSSLGELSAGVAHEIKNPLASIKGSLEIVASEFPLEHPKREFIDIMEREIGQLNRIVTEFLDFARAPRPTKTVCDIREIVDSLAVLCSQEAAKHSVELSVSNRGALPHLNVDASQVQQALLNIVLNGIQAMPNGGRLDIVLEPGESGGVLIGIADQGPGIPPEQRARIFDPFFTTKARGTGLGLPIAQKLIRAQGGEIRLLDDPEAGGALFIIELPPGSKS